MLLLKKGAILICAALLVSCGCTTDEQHKRHSMETYYQTLQDTKPHADDMIQQGSAQEREAIELFASLYAAFTEDNIRRYVRDLYAQNAYYRDGFAEVQGVENIESYLIEGAQTIYELSFDLQDVAVHDGNYYFRWITQFSLKRKKDEAIHLTGMSHVRFNKEGRIIFHQDFWDTGVIYESLPIIGCIIRWLKQKM
jgi:limonene-1,2-epoxide hydrolase